MAKYGKFTFMTEDDLDKNELNTPPEEGGGNEDVRGFDILSEEESGELGKDIEVDSILNSVEVDRALDTRKTAGKRLGKMGKRMGRPPKGSRGRYDKDRSDRYGKEMGWNWIKGNRYRNAVIAARKKGIDFLPRDVYEALWEAAGKVYTEWGEEMDAWKLTAKYYDERLRCIMIRLKTVEGDIKTAHIEDPDVGFVRGNVAIVLVKGKFRNHRAPEVQPDLYQVLATWESDGRILDRWGREVGFAE